MTEPIIRHLRTDAEFAWIGSTRCAAVHILGTEEKPDGTWVYAWGFVQTAEPLPGSGRQSGQSAPMTFRLMETAEGWQVLEHHLPRDGSGYDSSLKEMFPPAYLDELRKIQSDPLRHNQMVEKLKQICQSQNEPQGP